MKTLYLVRHAKSSWEFDLTDHQRPLNDRGLRDAPRVAAYVAEKMKLPDFVMSSDAMRAKTTAFFFAQAFGINENDIVLNQKLYDFGGSQLIQEIRACNDTIDCLMVFGHNNAMTNVVNTYGDRYTDNVPTAGFTAIQFETEHWADINQGKVIFSCTPKELKK